MSGGSLNYVYRDVELAAETIKYRARTPLHHAFAAHLEKVAKALHDLEWVFSCDYGDGDEEAAIQAVLPENAVLQQAIDNAREAAEHLRVELEKACAGEGRI